MFKNIQTKAECETDSATQKLKNEVKHTKAKLTLRKLTTFV